MFIQRWYADCVVEMNFCSFCFVEGYLANESVTEQSSYHLSIAVSQMWKSRVQHLPGWPGTWSLLVCLLARGISSAFRLYRQSSSQRGNVNPNYSCQPWFDRISCPRGSDSYDDLTFLQVLHLLNTVIE